MTTSFESMSEREIDALVAERVMGWESCCELTLDGLSNGNWVGNDGKSDMAAVPEFSTDIASAMQVEDRIAELGLQTEYALALQGIIARGTEKLTGTFDVIHATPRQRCLAALKAIE